MKTIKNNHLIMLFVLVALCFSNINTAKAAGEEIVNRPTAGGYEEFRWILIDAKDTDTGELLFPDPIKVRVRFVPKAMVWDPQGGSKDYNDPKNWKAWNGKDPSNHNGTTPKLSNQSETITIDPALEFVPWSCTDILIPDAKPNYPHLASDTRRTTRNDNEVSGNFEPVCQDVWFEHGGQLVRSDLLSYRKANIELRLTHDRWYMTSAPLRYMFAGDYWKNSLCPWDDKLQVYTQLFVAENPQQGANVNPRGDWTGPFYNPEVEISAGFGFATWLDDETYGGSMGTGTDAPDADAIRRHTMWFPKQNTTHDVYNWGACTKRMTDIPLTRTQTIVDNNLHHRFIYEQNNATVSKSIKGTIASNGVVPLSTRRPGGTATTNYGWIIVGNPFMASWNFDAFANNNPEIDRTYWVLSGPNDAAFEVHNSILGPYFNTVIAPMQSVIVSAVVPGFSGALKANVSEMMQRTDAFNKLRSASEETKPDLLRVVVEKDGYQNPTYVVFDTEATNDYKVKEDSYKLFVTNVEDVVSVYTRSSDNVVLDINVFGSASEDIQLGVRTTTTGEVTLKFEGVETFLPEENLFIIDKLTGEYANLRENPVFSFEKITDELFMDNRIYLSFNDPTGMKSVESVTVVYTTGTQLKVTSTDNIKQVQVVDMQGRTIVNEANINNRVYTRNLESNAMYIVKVLTDKESVVKKVITSNN